eukprot:g3952.t1
MDYGGDAIENGSDGWNDDRQENEEKIGADGWNKVKNIEVLEEGGEGEMSEDAEGKTATKGPQRHTEYVTGQETPIMTKKDVSTTDPQDNREMRERHREVLSTDNVPPVAIPQRDAVELSSSISGRAAAQAMAMGSVEDTQSTKSSFRRAALENLFQMIDADGDGLLSKREIVRAFALNHNLHDKLSAIPGLGDALKPSQLRAAIKNMDTDKNNAISVEEWVDYVEDCVDTTKLISAFEMALSASKAKTIPKGKSDPNRGVNKTEDRQLVPLDLLLENFDHTIVGASSVESLRNQITRTAGILSGDLSILISRDDWLDVAFSIMNSEDDKVELQKEQKERGDEEYKDKSEDGMCKPESRDLGQGTGEHVKHENDVNDTYLGSNLPQELATAAQSTTATQLALDAMKEQLSDDVYTTATDLNKEACGKTERELLLDGVLRRHSPKSLIKTAREAEALRIMLTLIDAQKALKTYIVDSLGIQPPIDEDGYLKKDSLVVSSLVKAVTDAVTADEHCQADTSPQRLFDKINE